MMQAIFVPGGSLTAERMPNEIFEARLDMAIKLVASPADGR